jgi:microcystin degradation protein MlrC
MRIGIVGLSIEVLLASPLRIEMDSVQEYEGAAIEAGDLWMIRGMLARLAQNRDVEVVPLYWATALPGGPLTEQAYARIRERTLSLIAGSAPLDGILIANHGALEVAGMSADGDADYVRAIRDLVGPSIALGLALDLHGDMTPELLNAVSIVSVLRTAPHRDDRETGFRAADQLLRVLRNGLRPRRAAVRIPLLVPGECAITSLPPARALYGSLPDYDSQPGIMEANILVGFAWNDRPWAGVTAVVVSEDDAGLARATASELASRIWAARDEFRLRMETAEIAEGLLRAAVGPEQPVFLSDSGDNTTAGAPGNLALVLAAALDIPALADVVVPGITAPEIVRRCIAAGPGSCIEIELGVEHRLPATRTVKGIVEACGEALELEGFQPYRSLEGPWARVKIGSAIVTFHARPIGITTPQHFTSMGIHPTGHKAYVVKLGYLHPQLEDVAARKILLLSPGYSQLDLNRLEWRAVPRPVHPLDPPFDWRPTDGLYGDA